MIFGFISASLWGCLGCLAFTSKHSVELRDAFVKTYYPNLSIDLSCSNVVSATCWGSSFTWLTQQYLVNVLSKPQETLQDNLKMEALVVFWFHKCFSLGLSCWWLICFGNWYNICEFALVYIGAFWNVEGINLGELSISQAWELLQCWEIALSYSTNTDVMYNLLLFTHKSNYFMLFCVAVN